MSSEPLARIERGLVGHDKGVYLVDPDIFDTDIGHQRVEHLTLGIADVALQFGE